MRNYSGIYILFIVAICVMWLGSLIEDDSTQSPPKIEVVQEPQYVKNIRLKHDAFGKPYMDMSVFYGRELVFVGDAKLDTVNVDSSYAKANRYCDRKIAEHKKFIEAEKKHKTEK